MEAGVRGRMANKNRELMALLRQTASAVAGTVYRSDDVIPADTTRVLREAHMPDATWMGARQRSADMWNYQETRWTFRPLVSIEFGSNKGVSSLSSPPCCANLRQVQVLSADVNTRTSMGGHAKTLMLFMESSSIAILNSGHCCDHVLVEMRLPPVAPAVG